MKIEITFVILFSLLLFESLFLRSCTFALHRYLCSSPGSPRERALMGQCFSAWEPLLWLLFQSLPTPPSPSANPECFWNSFLSYFKTAISALIQYLDGTSSVLITSSRQIFHTRKLPAFFFTGDILEKDARCFQSVLKTCTVLKMARHLGG